MLYSNSVYIEAFLKLKLMERWQLCFLAHVCMCVFRCFRFHYYRPKIRKKKSERMGRKVCKEK